MLRCGCGVGGVRCLQRAHFLLSRAPLHSKCPARRRQRLSRMTPVHLHNPAHRGAFSGGGKSRQRQRYGGQRNPNRLANNLALRLQIYDNILWHEF